MARQSIPGGCELLLYMLAYSMAKLGGRVRVAVIGARVSALALRLAKAIRDAGLRGVVRVLEYGPRALEEYAEDPVLRNHVEVCEEIGELGEADLLFVDVLSFIADHVLVDALSSLGERSVALVHGVLERLHRSPELIKAVVGWGFTRAVVPLGSGVLVLAKRAYEDSFLRKTVEVYRESFIREPNPIHYNTARLLYTLAYGVAGRASKAAVVEVGTGRGFSTLWLAKAVEGTGCRLYSFDVEPERVSYARRALESVGAVDAVDIVCGDARASSSRVSEGVVFLFIDGHKEEYYEYLRAFEDKLVSGALVVAHNTVSNAHDMPDYLREVYSDKYVSLTTLVDPAGATLSVKI